MSAKPATYNGDLSHLPAALAPLACEQRWVAWVWELRKTKDGEERWTKVPKHAIYSKVNARSNDPNTWSAYDEAVAAVASGRADGIGYMLADGEVTAADLDHCRDPGTGAIDPWAQELVTQAATSGAYVEVTVSGTGLRIIGLSDGGKIHNTWKINGSSKIELFRKCERYITVSGLQVGACEALPDLTSLIDGLKMRLENGGANGTGFDFNDAGKRHADDIESLIRHGAPEGQRSEAFQRVINHLATTGRGVDEILALLEQHPNGIAAKYRGRLREEIERSYTKWRERHTPGGGAPDVAPDDEPLVWSGVDKYGIPVPSLVNARIAVLSLGFRCRYDEFHDAKLIERANFDRSGKTSDDAEQSLRYLITREYRFDPGSRHLHDAITQLCMKHPFDPIRDYLAGLIWDGESRIGTWLTTYMGAEDTPLNRAIGRLALIAAVRRVRHPGCKFDQIIVLEGEEGTNKSTAIELMAGGDENFSDQTILAMNDQKQQECLKGRWLYEIADLSGIRRAEVEHVKAFASRRFDRCRRVYDREPVDQPRRCILFATTNDDTYLKSPTGNRRFWPVKTVRIDLAALRRDRDQLWAEAAHIEASGASIMLPGELWSSARIEQDKRMEADPWDDKLANVKGVVIDQAGQPIERVTAIELLTEVLGVPSERLSESYGKRLARCMRRLGWDGPRRMRIEKVLVYGYTRPPQVAATPNATEEAREWWRT
jgi:hypothetical protein